MVYALGDVVGLFVIGHQHGAALVVNAVLGVVVADALDRVTCDLDVVDMCIGGDFTGQHHEAGVAQGFRRYAGLGVLFENCVKNGIRNLVSDLVGMAFGYGFRGK